MQFYFEYFLAGTTRTRGPRQSTVRGRSSLGLRRQWRDRRQLPSVFFLYYSERCIILLDVHMHSNPSNELKSSS